MSPENIIPPPPPETQTTTNGSGGRKSTSQRAPQEQPPPPPLKCPRCDSTNTKFCYYNNYSLTQPRHFCKTCRRYWTKGGALRNVPIGGGCRKSKKFKSSTTATTAATSSSTSSGPGGPGMDFGPGFRFLPHQPSTSALEFQLGGLSLPRLHPATAGVYTQFITTTSSTTNGPGPGPGFGLDFSGLDNNNPMVVHGISCHNNNNDDNNQISISSIESLSSINQEMHWKLQQQRLALIYADDHDNNLHHKEKPQGAINLFQNLEINSTTSNNGNLGNNNISRNNNNNNKLLEVGPTPSPTPTEWLFDQIHHQSESTVSNLNGVHQAVAWGHDLHHHQFNGLQ